MNRRKMLGWSASLGAIASAGWCGRFFLLPPSRSRTLESVDTLARRLYEELDPGTRARACVDYDHPLRQYHNRGVRGGGLAIHPGTFTRAQRRILTDLLYAGLSQAGRERVPEQYFIDWPGIHLMNLVVCGDPRTPPYQIILSGPHLNLRIGGRSLEGIAFGGPLVYGDQRGNERQGLPGNVYRYQFELGQRLFRSLAPDEKRAVLLPEAPIQTQIELQGREGSFPGLSLAALTLESKALARELVDGVLSTYPAADVAYAWRCLEENGGLEGLFLSYYEDGEVDGSGQYQIFRLEGPAAVLYFRGHPHVHAFVNIAMDGDAPLSVGELLGENPAALEGNAVKQLFEAAMQTHAGTDLAYYDAGSVAGRLRKGPIRTGDVYVLESWQDHVEVVEVAGSRLTASLVEELRRRGQAPEPGRLYTIATTGEVVDELAAERLGQVESRRKGILLREATIGYLREQGFRRTS